MNQKDLSEYATKQDLLDLEKRMREESDNKYEISLPAWFYLCAVLVLTF